MQRLLRRLTPFIRPMITLIALIIRPMTLGVRILVQDEAGRILLVRHSYTLGWSLPGGGVDPSETMAAAALRELREECGIVGVEPTLFGIYLNRHVSRRDHVGLYLITDFMPVDVWKPNAEIREIGFFPIAALPSDTTAATQRRVAEVFSHVEPSELW